MSQNALIALLVVKNNSLFRRCLLILLLCDWLLMNLRYNYCSNNIVFLCYSSL